MSHPPAISEHRGAPADLVGLTRPELEALLAGLGVPERQRRMRARQLWRWIYRRGAADIAAMSDLPKDLRHELQAAARIGRPALSRHQASIDGTEKWLLAFDDGNEAEMVFIPERGRGALCVSSQVGCTLSCRFCHTGTQRLVRNLEAREIVQQFLLARDGLGEWTAPAGRRRLTNIVMMGMGEPLYNYDNVAGALAIVMDPEGVGLSKRRITLSTSGVVPGIERCGRELGVNLAISLHAVRDDLRDVLVPLNKKYPIAELLAACRTYPAGSEVRRITFEYVMLKDVNDSAADARELVRLLRDVPAKVNLIPFNPWPGAPYECSEPAAIRRFAAILETAGYESPVRTPRGRDILAACGQLKSASVRQRRSAAAPQGAAAAAPAVAG